MKVFIRFLPLELGKLQGREKDGIVGARGVDDIGEHGPWSKLGRTHGVQSQRLKQ